MCLCVRAYKIHWIKTIPNLFFSNWMENKPKLKRDKKKLQFAMAYVNQSDSITTRRKRARKFSELNYLFHIFIIRSLFLSLHFLELIFFHACHVYKLHIAYCVCFLSYCRMQSCLVHYFSVFFFLFFFLYFKLVEKLVSRTNVSHSLSQCM